MEFIEEYSESKVRELGILNVAYVGDAVWELMVRRKFVADNLGIDMLNKKVKNYVNARKQSEIFQEIESTLDENEADFARRARNAKIKSFPKSCEIYEYRNATALEALIGYYYLRNQTMKIELLIKKFIL